MEMNMQMYIPLSNEEVIAFLPCKPITSVFATLVSKCKLIINLLLPWDLLVMFY